MKKLIATILTAVLLLASSIVVFAEVTEPEASPTATPEITAAATPEVTPTATPKQKFENILVTRAEEMEKLQQKFKDLKAKIEAKRALIDEKKASFQNNKEEFKAFKGALFTLKAEIIDLMKEGNAIRSDNAKLRADLANSLNTMKEKGIELPADTQTALKAGMDQIKTLVGELKTTRTDIKDILKGNHEFRKNKDYAGLEAAFDQIKVLMGERNEVLQEINETLQDMVELIVAVEPTPTPTV